MTVTDTTRRAGPYAGNGATTAFSFSFKVFASAEITVIRTSAAGVDTTLVLDTDYSVALNADQDASPGGSVTYPISGTPLATGTTLTIVGNPNYNQTTELPTAGPYSARTLETQLDKIVIQIQQIKERLGRALQVGVTTDVDVNMPRPTVSSLIGWNLNADALENYPLSELAIAASFGAYRYDTFAGDGVTTEFALSGDPVTLGNMDVSIDGSTLVPVVDYNLAAGSLVFTVAPAGGTAILARYGTALPPGDTADAADITYAPGGGDPLTNVQTALRGFGALLVSPNFPPYSTPMNGTDADTSAFTSIAALSQTDIVIQLAAGDYVLDGAVLFTDKNLTIEGAGPGLTRILCTNVAAKIGFLDTSTSAGWNTHKRLRIANLSIVKAVNSSTTDGAIAIDAQWSYAGITASWDHAIFENIVIQGQSPARYWDKGIRLTDVGCVRINNVRFDNGGAQASNSTAAFEIRRLTASNITSFTFTDCFVYGTKYGLLFTHAAAPAGTIEGVWMTGNNEFVGVRHALYDDNQGTANTTRQINGLTFVGGFCSYSYSFAKFGYLTNARFAPLYTNGTNLADTGAALEAAIEINTYAEEILIDSARWLRNPSMAAASAVVLPTRDSCKRVRILGNSFAGGWDGLVDQVGTATKDKNRLYVGDNQREGVPLSTTASGYDSRGWKIIYNSAVAVSHTGNTSEYVALQISILGGSIGPKGRLRITPQFTHTNSANSKSYRIKLGGTLIWSRAETASVTGLYRCEMANRNSESSQVINQASNGGWGASTGALVTTAVDTSASQDLTITMQLGNSGETVTMEGVIVEVYYDE